MSRIIIIAEAGVNHNGDFNKAIQLIDAAAEAGADFVKFQTFKAEKIVNKEAKKAEYQIKNTGEDDVNQFNMLKKLEMPEKWHFELKAHAEKQGIQFLSTGFDEDSIDFLDKIGTPLFKIPSGELTNKPYLVHIAKKGRPVILSTGMANLDEIKTCMELLNDHGISKDKITILHCNTEYPTPMKDVNLLAMKTIEKELGVNIGYSDHTLGIEIPIAATALGAKVIEKHFTLDKNLPGPDHKASLEPDELKAMVKAIRNVEDAISGNGLKTPSASEMKNISIVRKSLHFNKELNAGHILSSEDFIAIRPGSGFSPMEIDNFIGKKLLQSVNKFKIVEASDFLS